MRRVLSYGRLSWAAGIGCLLALATLATQAIAADDPDKNSVPAGAATTPAADKPAAAEFEKQFVRWRELLIKLRYVQQRYLIATASQRPMLAQEFRTLLEEGQKLEPELTAAAERAFVEDPGNEQIGRFVVAQVDGFSRADNYEEAYRLGQVPLEHGVKSPMLYNEVAVAAACINEFAAARKYFELAEAGQGLSDLAKTLRKSLDKIEEQWRNEAEIRAAEAQADDLPRVKLSTSQGDIVVELFENEAPNTTANFISLVEKGFYNGTPFHRVMHEFMAQGGDPTGDGNGGPGYTIACECYQPNRRNHFRGSLSMAHQNQRDTGGSQFFLTFVPTENLNGLHTCFGRVVEGMEVLSKIHRVDPKNPQGVPPDRITKATVLRKRNHDYTPVIIH